MTLKINLVTNAGFEEQSPTNSNTAKGWETFGDAANFRWLRDSESTGSYYVYPHSGLGFLKVGLSSAGTAGHRLEFPLRVDGGQEYMAKAYVKADLSSGTALMYVEFLNASGGTATTTNCTTIQNKVDWTESYFTAGTAPAGTANGTATHAMLCLVLRGVGTVWFDDVLFTETYRAYIGASGTPSFYTLTGLGTAEITSTQFNTEIKTACLKVDEDTGHRWRSDEPYYNTIQKMTAMMTAHLCKAANRGPMPDEELAEGGALKATDYYLNEYDRLLYTVRKPTTKVFKLTSEASL